MTGFFLTLFENDFAWSQKEQTMLFPTLSPGSSAVKQENTRSIYRVIFFMAGGGGSDFFDQDPNFHFGTIFCVGWFEQL